MSAPPQVVRRAPLRASYDVRDYGATISAVDNQVAIDAAITAANAAGGGKVLIPEFYTVAGVTLKSNVELVGTGFFSGLKLKNSTNSGLVKFAAAATRCGVSNMQLDGNKANQTEDWDCFGVVVPGAGGVGESWVRDCWIHSVLRTGIYMPGRYNEASRNNIWDIGNTTNPGRTGIVMSGEGVPGGYARVIGNYIEDCTEYGIKLYQDSDHSVVADNVILNPGRMGIYIENSEGVSVHGNTVHGAPEHGILIRANTAFLIDDVSVVGNTVMTGAGAGITVWGSVGDPSWCRGTVVAGNTVSGNGGNGINLIGAPASTVTGNTITGNGTNHAIGDSGIFTQTSPESVISGNLIRNNGNATNGAGIEAYSPVNTNEHIIVTGNRIYDDRGTPRQKYGIVADNSVSMDYWSVIGNDVTGNSVVNLALDGANNTVANNKGWVTSKSGATSVADGGTVAHGLVAAPTRVRVTPSVSGEMASVTALGSTTFTVALKKHDGTAGTTATVYWEADV